MLETTTSEDRRRLGHRPLLATCGSHQGNDRCHAKASRCKSDRPSGFARNEAGHEHERTFGEGLRFDLSEAAS